MRTYFVAAVCCIVVLFSGCTQETGSDYSESDTESSSAMIGDDGTIYVTNHIIHMISDSPHSSSSTGSASKAKPATMYAINPDGTLRWTKERYSFSMPAMAKEGRLYAFEMNSIQAIEPTGDTAWTVQVEGSFNSLMIGPSNKIYGTGYSKDYTYSYLENAVLAVINADGTISREVRLSPDYLKDASAISSDGTVYAVGDNDRLYAVDSAQQVEWILYLGDGSNHKGGPIVGADGTIYLGAKTNHLLAIDPEGEVLWDTEVGSTVWGSPVLASNGTIYAVIGGSSIHAFDTYGSLKWKFRASGLLSVPVLDVAGNIYTYSQKGFLLALNPDGSERWHFTISGSEEWSLAFSGTEEYSPSPAVAADGTIYVGAKDKIYAINPDGTEKWSGILNDLPIVPDYVGPSNGGLAPSSWPMEGQNPQRTYCVQPVPAPMAQPVDDLPAVTVHLLDGDADESGDRGSFEVELSEVSAEDISLRFSTSGTANQYSDYQLSGLTIPAGAHRAVVTLEAIVDGLEEPSETAVITILATSQYQTSIKNSVTIKIEDEIGAGN